MSNNHGSRMGRIALVIGLSLIPVGSYLLMTSYELFGEFAACGEFSFPGVAIDCAAFNYGQMAIGWAVFVIGIVLSVVSAYYVGLSSAAFIIRDATRSEIAH